jgi:Rab9 effector protein with kelch motifs
MRECYSDVRIYYPQTHNWMYQRTYGDVAEARRNHCAVICGRFLFVVGGVNSYGKYMNDVVSLNLDTLKWFNYEVEGLTELAFASAMSLFAADIKMENPYLTFEYARKKGKKLLKLADEGIFIFGGRSSNGEAIGDLKVIKLGVKPLQVKTIETKGLGPSGRYMHSINYLESLNICVVYGGRDDSHQENIKNDMFLMDMESYTWVQVAHLGIPYANFMR